MVIVSWLARPGSVTNGWRKRRRYVPASATGRGASLVRDVCLLDPLDAIMSPSFRQPTRGQMTRAGPALSVSICLSCPSRFIAN